MSWNVSRMVNWQHFIPLTSFPPQTHTAHAKLLYLQGTVLGSASQTCHAALLTSGSVYIAEDGGRYLSKLRSSQLGAGSSKAAVMQALRAHLGP